MHGEQPVKGKWWRILSPSTLVSALLLIDAGYLLVIRDDGKGLNLFSAILMSVFALLLMVIDGILKVWVIPRTLFLWIIEIILIVAIPYLFQRFGS